MNNRFGFKDLILTVLLLAILVSLWIAMKQYDRQWALLRQVQDQVGQQTGEQAQIRRELGELRGMIESGAVVAGASATPSAGTDADPFTRHRAAREDAEFAEGDWLIDAFGANVAKITPLVSQDAYGAAIQDHVLETLGKRDPQTLAFVPHLARSWEVTTNLDAWQAYVDRRVGEGVARDAVLQEPDLPAAVTIRLPLRRGVTFSDGVPFTAQDVVFTWDLINNPQLEAPRVRKFYDKIRSVTASGDHEVVFEFREPYFESLGMALSFEIMPRHFYSQFKAEEINQRPGLLLGSGPYRMASPTDWTPGKPLELVRNERYWGVRPAFHQLVYREINNDPARLTMFRNGEIDVFGALPDQYNELLKDDKLVARSQHFEYDRINAGYNFIAWNQRRGGQPTPFADKRVRQAMTMLIDRQQVVDQVWAGFAAIATGPFHWLGRQADPSITPWPYDVTRAKDLLREAGYFDRNNDGVIDGPDGKTFSFKFTYPSGSTVYDRTALLLKDAFARAGIILEPDPLEWSVFGERLDTREFDAITMFWSAGIETDVRQMFHSDQIGEKADNFMSYNSPDFDRAVDEARRTIDEDARMALWQEVHRILHEDQPYTFMVVRKSLVFLDGRLRNVQRVPIGLNPRDEWFVPQSLQKWTR